MEDRETNSQIKISSETEKFLQQIRSDIESLCGECSYENGIMRAMVNNLGVSGSSAILEVVMQGMENGEDLPYPALYFHFTLAKEIEKENFSRVSSLLCELNTAITLGDFKSFGSFGLYHPLGQIYYSYRIPINVGALDKELENVRFFLATSFDQLDIFDDLVLYVADGRDELTLDKYMDFLKRLDNISNFEERTAAFIKLVDEITGQ